MIEYLREYYFLTKDFFQTRKKVRIVIIPLVIAGVVFYFSDTCLFYKNGLNIQTSILNVGGILLGFTISFFAILISGNSKSMEEAKKYKTKYKISGDDVYLYTTLIMGVGYIILIESVLLIINVLSPIFFKVYSFIGRVLFSISIFLLLHSIIALLEIVKDFYFIVTKRK